MYGNYQPGVSQVDPKVSGPQSLCASLRVSRFRVESLGFREQRASEQNMSDVKCINCCNVVPTYFVLQRQQLYQDTHGTPNA